MDDDKTMPKQTPDRPKDGPKPDRFPSGAPMAPASGDEIPALALAAKWGAQGLEGIQKLGKRVFAHIVIFAGAAAAALSSGSLLAGLCVYVGGICIFARGASLAPAWLVPAGIGVLQTLFLAGFGFPLPQALFWGGVQSFIQRLIQKRLRMGGEWAALLFILPIAIYLLPITPLTPLLASLAGGVEVGLLAARGVARRRELAEKMEALRKHGPPPPEKVRIYRESLEDFTAKIARLPADVQPLARSIAASTSNILECMAADERDIEPGHRFLNRYFKAAHSVVDKYAGLSREQVVTREMIEALDKSRETLARLDEVFAKEHTRLLRNDVTDFSADLAVIDTLLKMDGK